MGLAPESCPAVGVAPGGIDAVEGAAAGAGEAALRWGSDEQAASAAAAHRVRRVMAGQRPRR